MLRRLHGMLLYSVEPMQALLSAMPKDDLRELVWLRRYAANADGFAIPDGLSREEREFALGVFPTLGTTDLTGQLAHLEECACRAAELKEQARARAERSARAYASTGICAGLCIGLLLL